MALARRARGAGQGGLSQAARSRSQEAAHAGGRRRAWRTSTTATARCWSRRASSSGQFAEWIAGRNPGTYVAVHYIKLIDFTFGGRLKSVHCTGQRGIVGPGRRPDLGFDAVAARSTSFGDGREAAFDIHTSPGSRPTIFPAMSSRKCNSASTTACGTATAASAASSARSKAARRSSARSR